MDSDIANKFPCTCPCTATRGLSATSTMNNCIGFPSGVVTNNYTAQNRNFYCNFTDHIGTHRSVQIPAHAFYNNIYLATAINNLKATYYLKCAHDTVTYLLTFTDTIFL